MPRFEFDGYELSEHGAIPVKGSYDTTPDTFAVVRVRAAGICTSDVLEAKGADRGRSDFGHEVCGEIVYSPSLPLGMRVVLNPNAPAYRSSGFASHFWLERAPEGAALVEAPAAVDDTLATMLEPLSCTHRAAARALELGQLLASRRYAVMGGGFMGVLIASWLARWSANVTLLAKNAAQARDLQAHAFVRASGLRCVAASTSSRETFDVVILATAQISAATLADAAGLAAPQGRLHLYGSTTGLRAHNALAALDAARRVEGEATFLARRVTGSYGADAFDFSAAIDRLSAEAERASFRSLILAEHELRALPELLTELAAKRALGRHIIRP